MNVFDLLVIALLVVAGIGGFRLGFVTRVLSWAGMAVGLVVAARSLPWVFRQASEASPTWLILLAGATLLFGSVVGQAIGVVAGSRLRLSIPEGDFLVLDRGAGAVAGAAGVLVAVWILLPSMADVPGEVAVQSRSSWIAQRIDRTLPPPPDTLQALRQLVGPDDFPAVFDALRPAPDVGPPPSDPGLPAEVIAAVTPSTVKVQGVACGRIQEGSGFVVADGLVMTNAHVVAGVDDPRIERDDERFLPSAVVAFDPERDLAVLRVEGLERPPLAVIDGEPGVAGGVFGHPGGAPLRVAPFSVANEVDATGSDIYDRSGVRRRVLILASSLLPGDSGAALIDASGAVVGVAFAVAPDDPDVAYALDTSEVAAVTGGDLSSPVGTGDCLR